MYAWIHVFPSQKTHTYTGCSPTSLEQFPRAIWEAVSQAIVLSKTLNNTETYNSYVVCFSSTVYKERRLNGTHVGVHGVYIECYRWMSKRWLLIQSGCARVIFEWQSRWARCRLRLKEGAEIWTTVSGAQDLRLCSTHCSRQDFTLNIWTALGGWSLEVAFILTLF